MANNDNSTSATPPMREGVGGRPIPAELPGGLHRTARGSFRDGWRWPKDIRRWFARELSDIVDPCPQPIAHIPCGSSKLGELRVDAFHPGANVRADFFHLPFRDGSIGTIVSDPPFNLDSRERIAFHKELMRVLRVGGRLLWQAPWLPPEGPFEIERVTIYNQRVGLPRNARILVRARRNAHQGTNRPQLKAAERRAREEAALVV